MKCILCEKDKNVVYFDYDYESKLSIKLCYDCLELLGWKTEINAIISKLHKCPVCHQRYLSKKDHPVKCGVCWAKFFGNDESQEELIEILDEQKTLGVISNGYN